MHPQIAASKRMHRGRQSSHRLQRCRRNISVPNCLPEDHTRPRCFRSIRDALCSANASVDENVNPPRGNNQHTCFREQTISFLYFAFGSVRVVTVVGSDGATATFSRPMSSYWYADIEFLSARLTIQLHSKLRPKSGSTFCFLCRIDSQKVCNPGFLD